METSVHLRMFSIFLCFSIFNVFGYNDIDIETSVPYGDGYIKVWEDRQVKGRYFALPLVYLKKGSAHFLTDILTDRYIVFFDVVMWSEEAQEAVFRHLRRYIKPDIKKPDINMLPMEKIRLVWRNQRRHPTAKFELQDFWRSNRHSKHRITFSITCLTENACRKLQNTINTKPFILNDLELEYVTNISLPIRRRLSITGSCIMDTSFKQISQGKAGLLVSGDLLKTISDEAVTSCITTGLPDADYISMGDKQHIRNKLFSHLQRIGKTQIESPMNWSEVSWIPKWKHPGTLAKYLNQVFRNNENDATKIIVHLKNSDKSNFGQIEALLNKHFGNKNDSNIDINEVLKVLKLEGLKLIWQDEKFKPKPIQVFKITLEMLRQPFSEVISGNIRINTFDKIQSVKLRPEQPRENVSITLTPQLVESRLKDMLNKQEGILNDTIKDVRAVEELANVTNEHVHKIERIELIDSKLKLDGMKCRFEDSKLMEDYPELHANLLNLTSDVKNSQKCWQRCYRGSEHDYRAISFHHSCDGKGPTVTLVKVDDHIFGGYTDRNWGIYGGGAYYSSTNSFLFEVRKNVRFWSTKKPQYAIYNNNGYGPTFGSSHDLYISDRCKYNTGSTSELGSAYELPYGVSYQSSQARAVLAGSYGFRCDEYEVYYEV